MGLAATGLRGMPALRTRRSRPLPPRDLLLGPSGSTLSKSRGAKRKESVSRRRGISRKRNSSCCQRVERWGSRQQVPSSRSCWSGTVARSRRSSRSSASRGPSRRRSRSSLLLVVRPNRYYRRRKSPGTRRRVCQFSALRPRRGSVQGRLPRSQQSRGGRTAWWRLPA